MGRKTPKSKNNQNNSVNSDQADQNDSVDTVVEQSATDQQICDFLENNQAVNKMSTNMHSTWPVDVPKLKGPNYLNWRSMMNDLLELRGLKEIVDSGSTISGVQNLNAKLLIKSTLDEAHLAEVRNYDSAHDIWNHLSRMCIGANSSDVAMLVRKFYTYEYQKGDSMGTHLEKLSTMRTQLETIKQAPTDEVFIDRILQTLPAEFQKLKDNWDYLHPSQRTVAELKTRALKIEEESKQKEPSLAEQAFVIRKQRKFKSNETIEQRKKTSKCAKCGHVGHWYKECKTKPENYKKNAQKQKQSPVEEREDKPVTFVVCNLSSDQGSTHSFQVSDEDTSLKKLWIADSGATSHMCNQESWFRECHWYKEPKTVSVGDSRPVSVLGIGTVDVLCENGQSTLAATLEDVLFVPNLATNLLSIGKVVDKGISTVFRGDKVTFAKNNRTIATGNKLQNKLYIMNIAARNEENTSALFCQAQRSLEEWHKTFGHASKDRILKLQNDKDLGIKVKGSKEEPDCSDCPAGKARHVSHPSRSLRADAVGDIVFVDLGGPINQPSASGSKYYMLCKDKLSTYMYIYLLEDKTQTCLSLAQLLAKFEIETGSSIKRIHSDNGSEFCNKRVEILFALERVLHERSAPYTAQQNGQIEREMQSVVNMARTMLNASSLPGKLWDEALKTAVYIRNRLPNANTDKTPFEIAMQRKPRLNNLVEFGRQVHVMIDGHHLSKFEPRTEQAYIVGFTCRSNTYRVYLKNSERVTESCNVIFKSHGQAKVEVSATSPKETTFRFDNSTRCEVEDQDDHNSILSRFFQQYLQPSKEDDRHTVYHDAQDAQSEQVHPEVSNEDIPSPEFSPLTERGNDSLETVEQNEIARAADQAYLHISNEIEEPASYQEAIESPNREDWQAAIDEELAAHRSNETWTVVKRPDNTRLITTKWVFKIKTKSDGSIERFKARLVARGFEQRQGYDFFETFSPVARYDSIRALLAIASQSEMVFVQFDVQTAFLYGLLEEEVYTEIPEGLKAKPGQALRLKKGLYGLKQSPKVWNDRFTDTIKQYGFQQLKTDSCVFHHQAKRLILIIYVDDGLLFAMNKADLDEPIKYLKEAFKMRVMDGGAFVGLQIEKRSSGYFIHQAAYTRKILKRFSMENCKSVSAPLLAKHNLTEVEDLPLHDCPYREAIGALLYLATNSRPDILHAVTLLARYSDKPQKKHWLATQRVMRYLQGTIKYGLTYTKSSAIELAAYSDADWGSDVKVRKSISGTLILISEGPVIFRSSQQTLVSQSTTESEFIAAADTVKELKWLQMFLQELDVPICRCVLKSDSQTAIRLIKNPEFHRRTKHIDIKYHFIRDWFHKRLFELEYVPTEQQLADYLTKSLPSDKHLQLAMMSNIGESPG